MTTYYVYFHTRNDTKQVFYVGKGIKRRCTDSVRRSEHWKRIVKKANGFKVEIAWSGESEHEAYAVEAQLIAKLRDQNVALCNVADGGGGVHGYKHTSELKEYIRQKSIGNKSRTGQKATNEERKKISESRIGKAHSEQTKHKIGTAVVCLNDGVVYPTLSEAAEKLGLYVQNITHVCKGRLKQTGGYKFAYADGSLGRNYARKAA